MKRLHFALACSAVVFALSMADLQGQGSIFFQESWETGVTATFASRNYGSLSDEQFRRQNTVASAGSYALEHRLTAGDGISYATQHFGDARNGPVHANGAGQHFLDLYVQYKVFYSTNFDTAAIPKQLIIGTEDDRRHENVCCNPWVAHYMTIYPAFGRDWNAEANNKRAPSGQWRGFNQNASGYGTNNIFRMQLGRWYTVEVRRRLNDPGQENGIFQMWIDGTLISDHRDVLHRTTWNGTYGSNNSYGTNFVMISDYISGNARRDESVFYDDIKMSTAYIGTGGGSTTTLPGRPNNFRVVPGTGAGLFHR